MRGVQHPSHFNLRSKEKMIMSTIEQQLKAKSLKLAAALNSYKEFCAVEQQKMAALKAMLTR